MLRLRLAASTAAAAMIVAGGFTAADAASHAGSRSAPATSGVTIEKCLRDATRRPTGLTTVVTGKGAHKKIRLSGTLQRMPSPCAKLGKRTMKSYAVQSRSGHVSRLSKTRTFANQSAKGPVAVAMSLLGDDKISCTPETVSAFSSDYIASMLTTTWKAKKGSVHGSSTFLAIDTTQHCRIH